jgi:hypothetical protein
MPIKHVLTHGIGFSPGSMKYVITFGLSIGIAPVATETHHRSTEISVVYSDPMWKTGRAGFLGRITDTLNSYSDVTTATIGYQSASLSIGGDNNAAEDWIADGLGRHIETYNPSLEKRWEGFVNTVSVIFGPLSFTLGPLRDTVNRDVLKFNDFSTGVSDITSVANDTDSQAIYGILYKVLSGGKVSSTTADNLRDTYLQENKYPEAAQALGAPGDISITLECLGYGEMLNYPYRNTGDSTYTLREKLIDVINDEPNSIFSSDTSRIDANTLSVFEEEKEYRMGLDVVKELVAMGGDGNNNRTIFGIYEDQTPVYGEIPATVKYNQRLSDMGINIKTATGQVVEPWEVEVGQWVMFTDFLVGRDVPNDTFRTDPRIMFIESVTFTAPNDIQLGGGKTDTLSQKLAKLGLGGLG